jgi:hypothetical protein
VHERNEIQLERTIDFYGKNGKANVNGRRFWHRCLRKVSGRTKKSGFGFGTKIFFPAKIWEWPNLIFVVFARL